MQSYRYQQTSDFSGPDHPLYKTTLCTYFQRGNCNRRDKCCFAHGKKDLRYAPMCQFGRDCYNENCKYRHEKIPSIHSASDNSSCDENEGSNGPDRRFSERLSPVHISPVKEGISFLDVAKNGAKVLTSYKSTLCKEWSETGDCKYGVKCSYAHGTDDIKESLCPNYPNCGDSECANRHYLISREIECSNITESSPEKNIPESFPSLIKVEQKRSVKKKRPQNKPIVTPIKIPNNPKDQPAKWDKPDTIDHRMDTPVKKVNNHPVNNVIVVPDKPVPDCTIELNISKDSDIENVKKLVSMLTGTAKTIKINV